jgi:predicted kinase
MSKNVIILRGVPGSGKSTFASLLSGHHTFIACADDYFVQENGEYKFDASLISHAHAWCQRQFLTAMEDPWFETVIVANTNVRPRDFAFYEKIAKEYKARVFHVVMENRHGNKDIHNVPKETLDTMRERLSTSITL